MKFFPGGILSQSLPSGDERVSGWLDSPFQFQALCRELSRLGARRLRARREPDRRWVSRFPEQRIGRFRILPASARRPPAGAILLTQGQAFGTGLHPSTRLMLRAIEKFPPSGQHVLDVGAGSGILGFACLALGAASVLAVERDPAARRELKANRALNRVPPARLRLPAGSFPQVPRGSARFDLVLANLETRLLAPLMPAFRPRLADGGALLAGGIHGRAEVAAVAKAALAAGLRLLEKNASGDWWCLRFGLSR